MKWTLELEFEIGEIVFPVGEDASGAYDTRFGFHVRGSNGVRRIEIGGGGRVWYSVGKGSYVATDLFRTVEEAQKAADERTNARLREMMR